MAKRQVQNASIDSSPSVEFVWAAVQRCELLVHWPLRSLRQARERTHARILKRWCESYNPYDMTTLRPSWCRRPRRRSVGSSQQPTAVTRGLDPRLRPSCTHFAKLKDASAKARH